MLKLLWECLTVWHVPPTSLTGAQAIMSHAAGENSLSDPGLVNKYIANLIRKLHGELNVPVFVQGELELLLKDVPLAGVFPRQEEFKKQNGRRAYTDDLTVWLLQRGLKPGTKVVLVSYDPHYWRALRSTKKYGFEVLVPHGIRAMFDLNNSQKWARSKWVNYPYELAARGMSFLKGWL